MKFNDTLKALFCLFGFGLNLSSFLLMWQRDAVGDLAFVFVTAAVVGYLAYLLKLAISTAITEAASNLFAEGELTVSTKAEPDNED